MFAALNTFLAGGASAPLNTVAPAVTGTAQTGQTLSCSTGTWVGTIPITYSYQWQYGTTNISGATSSTYFIDRAYIGSTIRCVVTATNPIGAPTANSNVTSAVVAVPLNTAAPSVTGTATNGQTLSCSTGTWTGTATITFSYQWKRGGSNVGGNSSSYGMGNADVGSAMSCVVTGSNSQGSATGTSNSTAAVAAVVPGAPTGVSASASGSSTATVYFSAPSNGGASITTYTVYCSGGQTATGGGSGITVSGLTAASAYTFTVKATNSAGQGPASSASASISTLHAAGAVYIGSYTNWVAPAGITSIYVDLYGGNGTSDGPTTYSFDFIVSIGGAGGDPWGYGVDWSWCSASSSYTDMTWRMGLSSTMGAGLLQYEMILTQGGVLYGNDNGYTSSHTGFNWVGGWGTWGAYATSGTPTSSGGASFYCNANGPGYAGSASYAFGYTAAAGGYSGGVGQSGGYAGGPVSVSPGSSYTINPGSSGGYAYITWAAQ